MTLPASEAMLWRGKPQWRDLAIRAFHVRKVAIYFAVLAAWRLASAIEDGGSLLAALPGLGMLVLSAIGAVGVLCLLAWLFSRTTQYTITSRRVLMRFGVALPMTLNIPFKIVASAGVHLYRDGTADLPIALTEGSQVAYLMLWPHVRPWRLSRAQPMLRSVPDGAKVAEIFAKALAASNESVSAPRQEREAVMTPAFPHSAAA